MTTQEEAIEWAESRVDDYLMATLPQRRLESMAFVARQRRARIEDDEAKMIDYLRQYPSICAHIICESLGYASPLTAAGILHDAIHNKINGSEWIISCYRGDAMLAVRDAIRFRDTHQGFMADYGLALLAVYKELGTPDTTYRFGSWI